MFVKKERANAALALLLLASLTIACSALKNLGGDETAEANKLVQSGNEDMKAASKIADDNIDQKVRDYATAAKNNDKAGAKKVLEDSIKAIDDGTAKGKSAADKFDQASKKKITDAYKQYLQYKSQSVNKQVEAFQEYRKALVILRDNDAALTSQKAKDDYRQALDNFKKLTNEADDLDKKADEVARQNPDKIKA